MRMEQKKILYAEDNRELRESILAWFERRLPEANLEVFETGDSLDKRLQQGPNGIDLVLTDNNMPGSNGGRIIKKYAREKGYEQIPFILYYGDSPEIGEQAVREGAFAYLIKEGDIFELIQLVKSALKLNKE